MIRELIHKLRPSSARTLLFELVKELNYLQRSDRHISALQADLLPFIEQVPRIEEWTAPRIEEYLSRLRVGARRRDNLRDSFVRISRFARRRGVLPEDKISEAEKIPKIKPGHDVVTWSPAEAQLLLESIAPRWVPCEAIGLFAGLRRSEIFRLDWSAFKWEQRDRDGELAPIIAVTRRIARKIRVDRLVPILPNLLTWLEPYRGRLGPLYSAQFKTIENAHSIEMTRVRNATGLPRKDNANRHSFGSYRLAIVKNYEQVALEMGTSPRKVRENYNDPKSELEAMRYFALRAPQLDNVIPLSLALEFK